GGWWWPGAVLLVAFAGLAHTFQSAAVDFVRNAFLRIGVGDRGELDLPEDLERPAAGTLLERFGARVYRDYVVRQSQLFPRTVRLIRQLRQVRVPEGFRAEYSERQQLLLPLCSWLGQNIRFVLLGVAGLSGHIAAYLWTVAELGPVDFIDICTPTASHVGLTLWGLERGYHVLCEKPVALTRSEAVRIGDAARQRGRVVVPCHQYRFNPVWRQIKDWLREGA